MNEYRLSRSAVKDLREISDFIALDRPRSANQLLAEMHDSMVRLAENPGMGRLRPEFEKLLRSFPIGNYVIYYRVLKSSIRVIRVLNGARDTDGLFG